MPKLTLYQFASCPFCRRVVNYLSDNNIDISIKDTRMDAGAADELFTLTGGGQVPCLVIDGKPMLESGDIIQWFEEN